MAQVHHLFCGDNRVIGVSVHRVTGKPRFSLFENAAICKILLWLNVEDPGWPWAEY